MATGTATIGTLADLIANDGIRSVFQPIVDIDSLEVVGYEALARGPQGSAWELPAAFLGAAYQEGLVAELDWACRQAAYSAALSAGLDRRTTLFVNVEPVTLGAPAPAPVAELQEGAVKDLRVVLEITERAISSRPAQILGAAQWARRRGWGIALDDVGADPASLALLPLLAPDVVKLDLRLVQARPDREIAAIMTAVLAYAEQSGAALLAEGIETADHLMSARALGARYGQGYLFGRPGPLAGGRAPTSGVDFLGAGRAQPRRSPFEIVSAHRPTRPSTKPMLVEMAKHLEAEAVGMTSPAVVLAVFQDAKHFTPDSAARYRRLARHCPFVVALGAGLGPEPVPGVLGASISPDDILAGEWSVVVVGAHYAAALVARDLGDTGAERHRRFDYAVSQDRPLVLEAAASLLARALPPSGTGT
jgi:EAL domain-containing protein (putative c-di-GMP-specific phosphodiesterase class I)